MEREVETKFLEAVWSRLAGPLLDSAPMDFGTFSRRQLDMVLGDTAEMVRALSTKQLEELDRELEGEGLPIASAILSDTSKRVRRLLERGKLLTDDEFRLLNGWVSDVEGSWLTAGERELAGSMLAEYESGHD